MSSSKITLIGFYNYFNDIDSDLFANLTLPSGIDKETLTDNILMRGGEFESYYSNAEFIQKAIGSWSKKWYRTFDKWITALNIEFEPLENYDRKEDWTDTHTGSKSITGTEKGTNTSTATNDSNQTSSDNTVNSGDVTETFSKDSSASGTSSGTDTNTGNGTTTTDNRISAYNQAEWSNDTETISVTENSNSATTNATTSNENEEKGQNVTADSREVKTIGSVNIAGSNSVNGSDTRDTTSNESENDNSVHTARIHGNIGVTTSTQMLEDYLRVEEWNIYEHITDIFLSEFVIPLY